MPKRHTKETRDKISASLTGKKHTLERRKNSSLAHMGHRQPEHVRRKIALKLIGRNAPNWKGGITPLQGAIRRLSEYDIWRIKVFKRDNFSCRMPECSHRGRGIEANHIELFSEILRENNIKTTKDAVNCAKLWSVDNGITLCKRCHKSIRFLEKTYAPVFKSLVQMIA